MKRLQIGISTCPNDTYAFSGWLEGALDDDGLEVEWTLADVQELNELAAAGRLDVLKLSFAAAAELADDLWVLPVGTALGYGVGPLVLAPGSPIHDQAEPPRVLCPGAGTTASLLWRRFHPEPARIEQRLFSEIMPALERGEADFGVCIHEGRFTYAERGLRCIEDLGATWEAATGLPLPLGGIVARRALGPELAQRAAARLRASLAWADAHPTEALAVMRTHAQEFDDAALWQHVELYVNAQTRALDSDGRAALAAFCALRGSDATTLQVLDLPPASAPSAAAPSDR